MHWSQPLCHNRAQNDPELAQNDCMTFSSKSMWLSFLGVTSSTNKFADGIGKMNNKGTGIVESPRVAQTENVTHSGDGHAKPLELPHRRNALYERAYFTPLLSRLCRESPQYYKGCPKRNCSAKLSDSWRPRPFSQLTSEALINNIKLQQLRRLLRIAYHPPPYNQTSQYWKEFLFLNPKLR